MPFARFLIVGLLMALAATGMTALKGTPAHAQGAEIDAAKAEGIVGEQIDGYLGIRGAVDASLRRKVNEINAKRRAVYEELAGDSGTTVAQVARITGEKQIERAAPGEFYVDDAGSWVRKVS
ncbi:MAG: YdbL family protein [Pseudomonadota bacterium]